MPTHFEGTERQRLCLDTFIKLKRSTESLSARLSEKIHEIQLTESQFGVVEALFHLGPMCPRDLSQKILKSTGNMTLVLDNLEKRNLVKRIQSGTDRRYLSISLTPSGEELVKSFFPKHLEQILKEFDGFSDEDLEKFGAYCKKLGLTKLGVSNV